MVYEGVSRVKGTTRMEVHWRLNGMSSPLLGLKWQEEGRVSRALWELELKKKYSAAAPRTVGRQRGRQGHPDSQELYLPPFKLLLASLWPKVTKSWRPGSLVIRYLKRQRAGMSGSGWEGWNKITNTSQEEHAHLEALNCKEAQYTVCNVHVHHRNGGCTTVCSRPKLETAWMPIHARRDKWTVLCSFTQRNTARMKCWTPHPWCGAKEMRKV